MISFLLLNVVGALTANFWDLQHELENHETEIRMFDERLATQENIIDSLRQQLLEATQKNRDLVKSNTSSFDSRIASLEASVKNILADLHQLQAHANESSKVLSQHKQKLAETHQYLEHLQDSLNALLNTLQTDHSESTQTYRVQNGDSLEKIARKNNTTVKKLKELNDLTNDRIFVGQLLKFAKHE